MKPSEYDAIADGAVGKVRHFGKEYFAMKMGHLVAISGFALGERRMIEDREIDDFLVGAVICPGPGSKPVREIVAYLRGVARDIQEMDGGALSWLADEIERQIPVAIDEPPVWTLVMACTDDDTRRRRFGRIPETDPQRWVDDSGRHYEWTDLSQVGEMSDV